MDAFIITMALSARAIQHGAHRHDRRGIYRCVLFRFRGRIEIDHSYGLRWSGPAGAAASGRATAGPLVLCREWQHKPLQRRPYRGQFLYPRLNFNGCLAKPPLKLGNGRVCTSHWNLSLQWRHNDHDGVSNHQPHGRLFTQPFIQTQIEANIKAPRQWPLCGEFTGTAEFPHKGPVTRKMFPFDDVIMDINYSSMP